MVVGVDRGRWTCVLDGDPTARVTAMRARELGRTPVVVGDQVGLVGDLSQGVESLARIVRVAERTSVLRRTADDTDPYERVVVAGLAVDDIGATDKTLPGFPAIWAGMLAGRPG